LINHLCIGTVQLAAGMRAAWIPASAGMTKQRAHPLGFRQAFYLFKSRCDEIFQAQIFSITLHAHKAGLKSFLLPFDSNCSRRALRFSNA
jgi:hypothetical protein